MEIFTKFFYKHRIRQSEDAPYIVNDRYVAKNIFNTETPTFVPKLKAMKWII